MLNNVANVASAAALSVMAGAAGGLLVSRLFPAFTATPPNAAPASRSEPAWGALIGGVLVAWDGAATGSPQVVHVVFGLWLAILALVDLREMRLPNALTLPLAAAGLLVCALQRPEALGEHLLAALGAYGVLAGLAAAYRRTRGRDGLGLGDAKLLAAGGAWFGWRPLPLVVLGACGVAFAWFGWRALREGRAGLERPLPLGPPLCLALWIAAIYADG